jgi:hypothetical protein
MRVFKPIITQILFKYEQALDFKTTRQPELMEIEEIWPLQYL